MPLANIFKSAEMLAPRKRVHTCAEFPHLSDDGVLTNVDAAFARAPQSSLAALR